MDIGWRTTIITFTLAAVSSALVTATPAMAKQKLTFSGRVIGVADGDTITVLRDKKPQKIRLSDIDCPEKKQAYGQKAKQFTSNLCYGKTVQLNVQGTDRYGRMIAQVKLPNGNSLNQKIVAAGMGWAYKKYSKGTEFVALEEKARQGKTGLWSLAEPVPPWEFRKRGSGL